MADDWESALRNLTRKPPDEGSKNAVLNSMIGNDSDRAAALVMTSFVESSLPIGIILVLGINDQANIKKLFLERGILATFEARAQMATLLGIFGPEAQENLKVIRLVRNAFAHSMVDINFTTKEIDRACNRLTLSKNDDFFVRRLKESNEKEKTNRTTFGYACDSIYQSMLFLGLNRILTGSPRILLDSPVRP